MAGYGKTWLCINLVLKCGQRRVRLHFGAIFLHPTAAPTYQRLGSTLLASCQGFPKLSKRAGLALPAPGSPWRLQAGVKNESGREPSYSSGGSLELAPSTRLPLSRDRIPSLPSLGLARSQLPSSSLVGRALVELRHLSAPTPSCAAPGRAHAWGSTPGLRWGTDRSGCPKAAGATGGGARPWGCIAAPGRPRDPRLAPAPARSPAAAAGRLRAERKPRAQTGRGGWCERLGPVPARRGWNTMSRAGGRAGSENSLTQQLGKWVCSLTR